MFGREIAKFIFWMNTKHIQAPLEMLKVRISEGAWVETAHCIFLQRHRCGGGSQQCRLCWTHALGKTPFKPPTTEPLEMTHPFPWWPQQAGTAASPQQDWPWEELTLLFRHWFHTTGWVSAAPRYRDVINTLRAKDGGSRGRSPQQQQSQALRKAAIIWILDTESGDHLHSKITLASWIEVPE